MRICLYTSTSFPQRGGQESVVDALAREFLNRGHEVLVFAPRPRGHLFGLATRATNPYPVLFHPRFLSKRHGVALYRWFLLRVLREHRIDLLHAHGLFPVGYVASLAARRLEIPLVLTSHGDDVWSQNPRFHHPAVIAGRRDALAAADGLVSISPFTRQAFLEHGTHSNRIMDIPNGVHCRLFTESVCPDSHIAKITASPFLLFLGRLVAQKGLDRLIDAFRAVPDRGGIELVIAGNGPMRARWRDLARRTLRPGRAHFLDWVEGKCKIALLQRAAGLAIPSRGYESFGLVALEALAAGCPVLASNLQGLADLLAPCPAAVIIPHDDSAAWADHIDRLLAEGYRRRDRQAPQAQRFAQQFDWSTVAERHLKLYQHLLASQGDPTPSGWPGFGANDASPTDAFLSQERIPQ